MVRVAIIACILAVSLTRLISYFWGIPAVAYFSLVPFLIIAALTARKITIHPIDRIVAGLMLIGIAWIPIGILSSMSLVNPPPLSQQIKSVIWYEGIFFAYFAIRYVPLPKNAPRFFMLSLIAVGCIGALTIYLQQFGVIGSFYAVDDQVSALYGYRDAYGFERYRINGMYGNPHDAGSAMVILIFALYAWMGNRTTRIAQVSTSLLLAFALGALILTSSRSSLVVAVATFAVFSLIPSVRAYSGSVAPRKYHFNRIYVFIPILFLILIAPYLESALGGTLIYAQGLGFLTYEGRISSNLDSLGYLISGDTIKAIFGWGSGTGGMAAITGIKILPVNTVDIFVISILANYGILGLVIFFALFTGLILQLAKMFRSAGTLGLGDEKILVQFCLLAAIGALMTTPLNTSIEQKIYPIFTFLALGMQANLSPRNRSLVPRRTKFEQ